MKIKIHQRLLSLVLAVMAVLGLVGNDAMLAFAEAIEENRKAREIILSRNKTEEDAFSNWKDKQDWLIEIENIKSDFSENFEKPTEDVENIPHLEFDRFAQDTLEENRSNSKLRSQGSQDSMSVDSLPEAIEQAENYGDLSAEQKSWLSEYSGAPEEDFLYLQNRGYTIKEIIRYLSNREYLNLDLRFLVENCPNPQLLSERGIEIIKYQTGANAEILGEENDTEIKKLLIKGYSADEVKILYALACANEVSLGETAAEYPVGRIAGAVNIYLPKGKTKGNQNNFDSAGPNLIKEFLQDYSRQNGLETDEFETLVNGLMYGAFGEGITTFAATDDIPFFGDAPYSFARMGEENINVNSGALNFYSDDIVLPGKNGFDFVLSRYYDSGNSSLTEPYIQRVYKSFYVATIHVSPKGDPPFTVYLEQLYNTVEEAVAAARWWGNNYDASTSHTYSTMTSTFPVTDGSANNSATKVHGLGQGWQFNIPYISETVTATINKNATVLGETQILKYLHLESGKIYEIDGKAKEGGDALLNYAYEDFTFKKSSGEKTIDGVVIKYDYVMSYQSGNTKYFDEKNLVLYQDKFENSIRYVYEKSGDLPKITVIDSLNRTIVIEGKPTESGYDLEVKLDNEVLAAYGMSTIPNNSSFYVLSSVTDQIGRKTDYSYSFPITRFEVTGTFKIITDRYDYRVPSKTLENVLVNLTAVNHPTGGLTEYSYQTTKRTNLWGYEEWGRITQRANKTSQESEEKNLLKYNYSSVGYSGYVGPNYANKVAPYTTVVTNSDNVQTTYSFNTEHLKTSESALVSDADGNRKIYDKTTTYVSKLPASETTKTYSGNRFLESTRLFEYNTRTKKLLKSWSVLSNGTKDPEYQTTYTYDSMYQLPLSVTYKTDSSTTVSEEFTLTDDKKNIEWKKIFETKDGNKVLKEATEYTYDSDNNIKSEKRYYGDTDALNTFTEVRYDYKNTNADLPSSFDGAFVTSATISAVKDIDGNLIETPNGGGIVKTDFKYDVFGRIIEQKNASQENGYSYFTYDGLGRKIKEEYSGIIKQTRFDDNENRMTIIDERGNSFTYRYDALGSLTEIIDDASGRPLSSYSYDNNSRIKTAVTYGNSGVQNVTVYTYDSLGRKVSEEIKDADGKTLLQSETEYDSAYESKYLLVKTTVTGDENSPSVTTLAYTDKYGRTEKEGALHENAELLNSYTYDYVGNTITELSALDRQNGLAATKTTGYDYAGRVIWEKNSDGAGLRYTYDALGRKTSVTDEKGAAQDYQTEYTYDILGNVIKISRPMEEGEDSVALYYYNADSLPIKEKIQVNAPGQTDRFSVSENLYSRENRLEYQISHADTGPVYTHYRYDKSGNVTHSYIGMTGTDTSGAQLTRYAYDRFGNMTEITYNDGKSESFEYELSGLMFAKTDRSGLVTSYSYDAVGRLLLSQAGEEYVKLDYTATGQKLSEENNILKTTYTYDDLGRLTQEKNTDRVEKLYTYDAGGNRTSFTLLGRGETISKTEYGYDSLSRLKTVEESGNPVATYSYDINGNRESLEYAGGVIESYDYNRANLVTDLHNKNGDEVISSYHYTYYLDGNQSSKTDHEGKITLYEYDKLGRLSLESTAEENTVRYTYDNFFNRSTAEVSGIQNYKEVYSYNSVNHLIQSVKTAGEETETAEYTYDERGNRIKKEVSIMRPASDDNLIGVSLRGNYYNTYKYDSFNRQTESFSNGIYVTYKYTADGLRYSKTIEGRETVHIWDAGNIAAELTDGNPSGVYVRGMNLLARKKGPEYNYYLYNAHGEVVQLVKETGEVFWKYDYDAFGAEKRISEQDNRRETNPFRYCGEYFDRETETVYLRARYYDPVIGQFTQQDPIRDGLNWYTYCGGNPVMYSDPTGKNPLVVVSVWAGLFAAADSYNTQRNQIRTGQREEYDFVKIIFDGIGTGCSVFITGQFIGDLINMADEAYSQWAYEQRLAAQARAAESSEVTLERALQDAYALEGVGNTPVLFDGSQMTSSDALDLASEYLGINYVDCGNGRFVSADGIRQVRMGDSDILGFHGGGPHMNFEALIANPNKPGKMMVIENTHIYLTD